MCQHLSPDGCAANRCNLYTAATMDCFYSTHKNSSFAHEKCQGKVSIDGSPTNQQPCSCSCHSPNKSQGKCQCPIQLLFGRGHLAGCPEKSSKP